jgi:hypothetical protein
VPRFLRSFAVSFQAKRMGRFVPAEYMEEMEGVAQGAGIDPETVVFLNVLDDLLVTRACSAFSVKGGKTASGELLCGRNLDYPIFIEAMTKLETAFYVEPSLGFPFLSLGWPGYVGVATGMNKHGLVLCDLTSLTSDWSLAGVPSGLLNRDALQYSCSLAEMEQRLVSRERTGGKNMLISSKEDSRVLELSAHHWQARGMEGDVLSATNHYQTWMMKGFQKEAGRTPPGTPLTEDYFTLAFSCERNDRLRHLCREGSTDLPRAMEMLREPGIGNEGTVQSAIFLPGRMEVWVATRSKPPVSAGNYTRLTFDPSAGD